MNFIHLVHLRILGRNKTSARAGCFSAGPICMEICVYNSIYHNMVLFAPIPNLSAFMASMP